MNNNQRERRKSAPYTESTFETTITQVEEKLDKFGHPFWIIRTGQPILANEASFLAFSRDYDLSPKTKDLLQNRFSELIDRECKLVIRKRKVFDKFAGCEKEKTKVIRIELLEKIKLDNYEPNINN